MNKFRLIQILAIAILTFAFASMAQAQATRTWVSGVGDDANPCSRTAPCKTFAGAISKTAVDGEIDALDPGGFGAVTITKAITIDGNGWGSILAANVNGIIINLTVSSGSNTVQIRRVSINGAGTTTGNGIRVLSSVANVNVFVEDCVIFGFRGTGTNGRGIVDERTNVGNLYVEDTLIKNNGNAGVLIQGTGGGVKATLNRVRLIKNAQGINVKNAPNDAVIRDSVAANNASAGFGAETSGTLEINNCLASNNAIGIDSNGAGTVVRLTRTEVRFNTLQGLNLAGGTILSFGTNEVEGNGGNQTFTPGGPNLK